MNSQTFTRELGERFFHLLMEGYSTGKGINTVEEVANRIEGMMRAYYSDKFNPETFSELVKDMKQCYYKTISDNVSLHSTFSADFIILEVVGDRGYVVDEYIAKLTPKRGKENVSKVLEKINKAWNKDYTLEDVTIVKF